MPAPPQHTSLTPIATPSDMPPTKPHHKVNTTLNPIIPGFAPDPTIVYHDGLYYLCNSSFHLRPALPIYTSSDLIHWTLHSHALPFPPTSPSDNLSLLHSAAELISHRNPDSADTKLCFQGGLYAPTLRYEERSRTWYLLCTNVVRKAEGGGSRSENFWVTTKDIKGGVWGGLTYFEFEGIDPSIHFTYDGEGGGVRGWVVGSRGPGPGTKINLFEVDLQNGKKLSEEKTLWEGELRFYPEGPHLWEKGGWWWLVIAEGGTHEGHVVNVARSKRMEGPYEACPDNPVVKRCEYGDEVQCTGHMDFVEGPGGQWYGVCLGIRRSGEKGCRMTHGRETFLTRVWWPEDGDGWLRIEKVGLEVEGLKREGGTYAPQGEDWLWVRDAERGDFVIEDGGRISVKSREGDLDQWEKKVGFVGRRQRLMEGYSQVVVGEGKGQAGLAVYKDEHRFVMLFREEGKVYWKLLNRAKDVEEVRELGAVEGKVSFRIAYQEEKYVFSYKEGGEWKEVAKMDTERLSGSDFVGPVIGVFATGGQGAEIEFEEFVIGVE